MIACRSADKARTMNILRKCLILAKRRFESLAQKYWHQKTVNINASVDCFLECDVHFDAYLV